MDTETTDHTAPTTYKNYIIGLTNNVPAQKNGHNSAWAKHWKDILETSYGPVKIITSKDLMPETAERLFLYPGINFSGSFNFMGGFGDSSFTQLVRSAKLIRSSEEVRILDHDMPDLETTLLGRLKAKSTTKRLTEENAKAIAKEFKGIEKITQADFVANSNTLAIGDSHTFGVVKAATPVIRLDAKTLQGAIHGSGGLYISKTIEANGVKPEDKIDTLTVMFGSIDVRHHLLRERSMEDAKILIDDIIAKYINVLKDLQVEFGIGNVEVHSVVPIEREERKMAGTTKYKDQPFAGTREERREITEYLNSHLSAALDNANLSFVSYPCGWFTDDDFHEKMEKPRGIHIGEEFYRKNSRGFTV